MEQGISMYSNIIIMQYFSTSNYAAHYCILSTETERQDDALWGAGITKKLQLNFFFVPRIL